MRKRIWCDKCDRPTGRRLYVRKQVFKEFDSNPPELSAIITPLRTALHRGRAYYRQRFVPAGYWCGFCGYVHIELKHTLRTFEE